MEKSSEYGAKGPEFKTRWRQKKISIKNIFFFKNQNRHLYGFNSANGQLGGRWSTRQKYVVWEIKLDVGVGNLAWRCQQQNIYNEFQIYSPVSFPGDARRIFLMLDLKCNEGVVSTHRPGEFNVIN